MLLVFPWTRNIALIGLLLLAVNAWGGDYTETGFSYDPLLAGEQRPAEQGVLEHLLRVETVGGAGGVRLATETPIAPYLEAVRDREPTADELRLFPEGYGQTPFERYQFGVGVGFAVEDKASLNLGYRIRQPLSLLDEQRQDLTEPHGDLRVFFDFKVPLD